MRPIRRDGAEQIRGLPRSLSAVNADPVKPRDSRLTTVSQKLDPPRQLNAGAGFSAAFFLFSLACFTRASVSGPRSSALRKTAV